MNKNTIKIKHMLFTYKLWYFATYLFFKIHKVLFLAKKLKLYDKKFYKTKNKKPY